MRFIKLSLYSLLIIFILLVSLIAFLLTTTPGLYVTFKLANLVLPGQLYLKKPTGHLISPITAKEIGYQDKSMHVQLQQVTIEWQLKSLFHKQFDLKQFAAEKLLVEIKDTPKTIEKAEKTDWAFPELPIVVNIEQLTVKQFEFIQLGVHRSFDNILLRAHLGEDVWRINQFKLNYGLQSVYLNAQTQTKPPYQLNAFLKFKPLKLHPEAIDALIKLKGDLSYYEWDGQFKIPATGYIKGSLTNVNRIESTIHWKDAKWLINKDHTFQSEKGHISVSGLLSDYSIIGDVRFKSPLQGKWHFGAQVKNENVDVTSRLSLPEGQIHTTLFYTHESTPAFRGSIKTDAFNVHSFTPMFGKLSLKTDFSGNDLQSISADTTLKTQYLEHLLVAHLKYEPQQFSFTSSLGPNHIELSGKAPYPVSGLITIPKPDILHPSLSGLQTNIRADVNIKNPQKGDINLTISPGQFITPDDPSIPPIPFKGGFAAIKLTPRALTIKSTLTLDRHKQFTANATLPNFNPTDLNLKQQKINATFNLDINSLAFLAGLNDSIEAPKGQIHAVLKTHGTLARPNMTGEIRLSQASVHLPNQNLTLNPIDLQLTTQNNSWNATGNISSNGTPLSLKGEGTLSPTFGGRVSINGTEVPVMNTSEYNLNISPDLNLEFQPGALNVQGSVLIPKAKIKPISFSDSESLTSDAIFVDEEKKSEPMDISTDVTVTMGENVELDVKGLQGFLDGSIQLRKIPKGELFAVGELRVRDGHYSAYGQNLTIDKGEVMFTGGRITNPGIRVRAVRRFNNTSGLSGSNQIFDFTRGNIQSLDFSGQVTVGIEVVGRVENPEIKLFSVPQNLSQSDILSMLLVGKPTSQVGSSGGQILLSAINSMNLDSGSKGTQLLQQIKSTLGLDFDMQSSSSFNQASNQVTDKTSVVVGKPLSDRLYLSYNMGLFQDDGNVLTLKYMLNKFFNIQVSASDTGSGIDFFYSRSIK